MHDAQSHIAYLVSRLKDNSITQKELKELLQLAEEANEHEFVTVLRMAAEHQPAENIDAVTMEAMWQKIREKEMVTVTPVHRVHFLKTAWLRYAAAVIILVGTGIFIWNVQQKEKSSLATTNNPVPVQNDALPGGNHAVLTLADGRKIQLDDVSNGTIAREGNAIIDKTSDGQIIYRKTNQSLPLEVAMNTMSTPRGGQYQLVLPDGSRVWLNAESSITYPASFIGNERKVSITGEAYFEVTKDAKKPFRVTAGNETIEVLGTKFNVNAYTEESGIKTSLAEGSVKVGQKLLKPGEAYLNGNVFTTDLEYDLAWKDGVFNFENANLQTVMRQLARWYDIEVIYEGQHPDLTFGGEIGRDLRLSQVLDVLKDAGVDFSIEGKKVIVHPGRK